MGRVSVAAATSVITAGLVAACGSGAATPSEIGENDLAQMVLQREDVPAGLIQLQDSSSGEDLSPDEDDGARFAYGTFFQRPPEDANASEIVCVGSDATVFDSVEAAHRRFEGEREGYTAAANGTEIKDEVVSRLGDEAFAVRFPLAAAGFCELYDSEATDALFIMFRIRNVVASLLTFVYEPGDPLDQAPQLAQKQANRIEDVFEGESSD